jgi:hypothetical protein
VIVKSLPGSHRATFLRPIRESSWVPVATLIAYMETAKRLLAADDADFYASIGRYAGRQDREGRAVGVMLDDPETAAKLAQVLWRSFFDTGSLEVVEKHDRSALLRVHGFASHPTLCARIGGSLEGQFGARATETRCASRGNSYCEWRLEW